MIDFRERVFSILGWQNNLTKHEIVEHFMKEGFKGSTIYDAKKRYKNGLVAED